MHLPCGRIDTTQTKERVRLYTRISRILCALLTLLPCSVFAASDGEPLNLHMTTSAIGLTALALFIIAYALVMCEEFIHLRKSKPVVLAAGIIWALVAWACQQRGLGSEVHSAALHNLLEYSELFLFLLVAMTYINAMEERRVFEALRAWLIRKGFSYRKLFWITGILSFFISPIADNLTTALLMCAVVMAVGADNPKFVGLSCINIVVAANAGGAFSPFGDITTLMVWQDGALGFFTFFHIFVPSVVSYLIPAACMHFAIPKVKPPASDEIVQMKFGAKRVIVLFLLTIVTAVSFHNFLHLSPVLGMMTGLGYLQFFAYYIKIKEHRSVITKGTEASDEFDIFQRVRRAEWDTLLFFYGVILCVGGLATLGYLSLISHQMYDVWGAGLAEIHKATPANTAVGFLSAIIDNIPVIYAVLTMHPEMSQGQWLLVTLTAGIGGSMLSIGSAAGVALMGQSRGRYTFFGHLKWSWAIMLGYFAAIYVHIYMNADFFHIPISMTIPH